MKPSLIARRAFVPSLVFGLLSILSYPPAALTQSATPQSYRLATMKFAGLSRFNETQASKATGLQTGDTVTQAQLAAAVDKLAKSGAFENAAFGYSTNGNSVIFDFQGV